MFLFLPFLLALAQAALVVHDSSFVPDIVLEASYKNINIDCQTRRSVVINGTSPGPLVRLKEGKTSWIRVYNNLKDDNLTIHWHGLSQRTAPFSDGTPLIAQWPIPPLHFFDYEVRPEKNDAGSYFYHSHVGAQQISAFGPLIVDDVGSKPYKYDDERVMLLGNYFNKTDETIIEQLLASPIKWPGEAVAIAVNGKTGTKGFGQGSGSSCRPLIIDVKPNKTYRLRVIGGASLTLVKAVIQAHSDLFVIEADGEYTKKTPIDHIQAGPGQRFSFLLKTKTAKELKKLGKTQFWIRYESRDRPVQSQGYALLRYNVPGQKAQKLPATLPSKSPVKVPTVSHNYLEYKLQPNSAALRKDFPRLDEVTRRIELHMSVIPQNGTFADGEYTGIADWTANAYGWQETHQAADNRVPYLVNIFRNGTGSNYTAALQNNGFDPSTQTYPARVGEVLEIVLIANGGIAGFYDTHPLHFHAKHYYDIGSGNGTYNPAQNEKKFAKGFVPARRDTTNLYRYIPGGVSTKQYTNIGWRAWRIRVDKNDIGSVPILHCHIVQVSVKPACARR